jgi:hypothetical protein
MFVSPLMSHVVASDGDENIIFDEDEDKDEGFLFTGQGIPCDNYLMLRFHVNQHDNYQRMMTIPS